MLNLEQMQQRVEEIEQQLIQLQQRSEQRIMTLEKLTKKEEVSLG
jgi:hypothetical protein